MSQTFKLAPQVIMQLVVMPILNKIKKVPIMKKRMAKNKLLMIPEKLNRKIPWSM